MPGPLHDHLYYEEALRGVLPNSAGKQHSWASLYKLSNLFRDDDDDDDESIIEKRSEITNICIWFNPKEKTEWIVQILSEKELDSLFQKK
jgi:hypothetical protein